jgi:hypothetical protein
MEMVKVESETLAEMKPRLLERHKTLREELDELERVLNVISPIARTKIPRVENFKGLTVPQCAKQLLLEAGHTLTTAQMMREMLLRGWETKSKRPITVVHSGLAESPYIQRVGKRWDLSPKGVNTEF